MSLAPKLKGRTIFHSGDETWTSAAGGLQRLAAFSQVCRLSSSIFAALFSCDNDFTPVSCPFTRTDCLKLLE